MGDWTGTVPTILAGDVVTGDDWDTVLDIETALTGAWTTWVPTLANITNVNGTLLAKYRRLGKTVDWKFRFTLGSSSAIGTGPKFSLPVTQSADYVTTADNMGMGYLWDITGSAYLTSARLSTTNTVELISFGASSVHAGITATAPFTWATGDHLSLTGTFYTD